METKKPPPITNQALKVIRLMAMDKNKSKTIANDAAVLGGVVMILSNEDPDLVKNSVEILFYLSRWQGLHQHMRSFIGLLTQLQSVKADGNSENSAIASSTLDNLAIPFVLRSRGCPNMSVVEPNKEDKSKADVVSKIRSKRNALFHGTAISKSKMLQFVIRGLLDRDDMDLCRNSILSVKGVISITFDYYRKRVILRISSDLKAETIAESIASTMTMTAEQIVRDENGIERFISFKHTLYKSPVKQVDMPDYPEEDDPQGYDPQDTNKSSTDQPVAKRMHDGNGNWIGQNLMKSVGSFISNSFYW